MLLDGPLDGGGIIYLAASPKTEDYHGELFRFHPVQLKNCTEALVLTQPKMIEDIHRAYLEAGSDIIETSTFNASMIALEDFASWRLWSPPRSTSKPRSRSRAHAADDFTRAANPE